MPSFTTFCRTARDRNATIAKRYRAVRHAAVLYTFLTQTGFQSVFADLHKRCGFGAGAVNEADVIVAAADTLEKARVEYLGQLAALVAVRCREKRAGRRRPPADFLAELRRTAPLGTPRWG